MLIGTKNKQQVPEVSMQQIVIVINASYSKRRHKLITFYNFLSINIVK